MKRIVPTLSRWLTLIAAALVLFPPGSLAADPARGSLLIASRDLLDPNFSKSIVLLLHYDDDGAFGVMINRRTQMRPTEILPDVDALEDYRGLIYRTEESTGAAEPIIDGVVVLTSFESLNEIVTRNPAEASLRLYAGYAGWGPGQLDRELARDDWHLIPARSEDVFSDKPDELWQRLIPLPQPLQVKLQVEAPILADSNSGR